MTITSAKKLSGVPGSAATAAAITWAESRAKTTSSGELVVFRRRCARAIAACIRGITSEMRERWIKGGEKTPVAESTSRR